VAVTAHHRRLAARALALKRCVTVAATGMRILFMADVAPNPYSGAAGTEFQTVAALRALGHEVDEVWSATLGRRIGHGNLHYALELPRAYRREMLRALKQREYDAVHVNQPHGWLAAKTFRQIGAPGVFVHRSHGLEPHVAEVAAKWRDRFGAASPHSWRTVAAAPLHRALASHAPRIARWADGHIVSSTADGRYLSGRLGVDPVRVAVIAQAAPDAFLVRPAPPLGQERLRRILYVGQFTFVKAPMIVASAMSSLAGDAALRFTWVCDRRHHAAIRELLDTDRVELLDWTTSDRLMDIYDQHGIFLFPSFFEGFGKAFLEAMSRGLCVVASDTGGMHDVIENGRTGLLVPPGDAGAVAAAVQSLQRDPARAEQMSAAAATAAGDYTWERVARATTAFYQRLREAKR
jgi:glycosyltransferase involved in cell wall biosynthesis